MLADPAPQKLAQLLCCLHSVSSMKNYQVYQLAWWHSKNISAKKEAILKQIYINIYLLPKGQNLSTVLVTEVLVRRFSGGSVYAERIDETENVF